MFLPRRLRATCLLSLCFLQVVPGLTADASAAPPAAAAPVKPLAATPPTGPGREVFGYALSSSLGSPTVGYTTWNFDDLSTVAFFALHVNANGTLAADANMTVWNSSTLTGLVTTAHAHNVKVVVTIVTSKANLCNALYNDQTTVTAIVAEVQAKGIDGVNIDYEGSLVNCTKPSAPPTSDQTLMTQLARDMRAGLDAVNPDYYLSIATYSGSAAGTGGFFNIPALNQYVDSFFVMAYDMDAANQGHPPLDCASFCMGPVSPLAGYYWNDTTSMSQYVAVVGAAKTILGQPYYGRVACISTSGPHAIASSNLTAATYLQAAAVPASPDVKPGSFLSHRDPDDPKGMDRWDTWYDYSLNCWREMHWSDATTLSVRYKLVNDLNLRGVGVWALNYGGGATELWSALATYFKTCYRLSVSTSPSSPSLSGTRVTITAAATCAHSSPSYHFAVMAPGTSTYQVLRDYTTDPTFSWDTTGLRPGTYRFSVWAQDAGSPGTYGNAAGRWDVYDNSHVFNLTSKPCTSVGVSASPRSPSPIGKAVTFTAAAASCPNPLYNFSLLAPDAVSYQVVQPYSTSNTFNWSASNLKPGTYRLSVWARDNSSLGTYGNSIGRWDAYNNGLTFTLTSCTAVKVSVSPASPAASGTRVTLTATSTGCGSPEYHFGVMAPGDTSYQLVRDYSTGATYSWDTTGLAAGEYRFSVWVRDSASTGGQGNSTGTWDAYNNSTVYLLSG